ncbi:Non-structural maintenance of chromosomes element 1 like protein [Fukomys damarensis]|uniref:Non-structural maintenance of chromosomes element 1 homolog n=1 Tax=Fukomys damarensis TaxID=885580 RepID=A0A091DN20_FUKDA|nr:Non-structural maintenance of chromosomes element 1 like protein [Fukomys damarensis]
MGVPFLRSSRPGGCRESAFRPQPFTGWAVWLLRWGENKASAKFLQGRRSAPLHMQGSAKRMGTMTDVHRRFLQLLMTHGVLEEWDVKRLQNHCYKVHNFSLCKSRMDFQARALGSEQSLADALSDVEMDIQDRQLEWPRESACTRCRRSGGLLGVGGVQLSAGGSTAWEWTPVSVRPGNAQVDKLEDFINNINSALESLYIEIKKGVTEDDGRPIYALVNLATTPVSKMSTDFAENELDLFRKALEMIVDSETGFASSTNILNLVDQLKGKKMKKKEAEQVLQKFVQSKWLIEKEGEFTLHGRAILEMEQYIRETYPDSVRVCNICHGLLIQGQSCETCGIRMHRPCVAKYFQSSPDPRCPHCDDFWPHEVPEVFDPEKEREAAGSRSSRKSLRSRQH